MGEVCELSQLRRDRACQTTVGEVQVGEVCELSQLRRDRACQTTAGEAQAPQVSELADPSRNLASDVLIAQIQHTLVCDAVKHPLGYRLVHWLARFAVAHDGLSVCGLGYRSR